jgi:hypothetical protein
MIERSASLPYSNTSIVERPDGSRRPFGRCEGASAPAMVETSPVPQRAHLENDNREDAMETRGNPLMSPHHEAEATC